MADRLILWFDREIPRLRPARNFAPVPRLFENPRSTEASGQALNAHAAMQSQPSNYVAFARQMLLLIGAGEEQDAFALIRRRAGLKESSDGARPNPGLHQNFPLATPPAGGAANPMRRRSAWM
jgi:hypothetical protein